MGRIARSPEYGNWLDHIDRVGGELKWIMQPKEWPQNTSVKTRPKVRNGSEIKEDVLKASRVKEMIKEESERRGCSIGLIDNEAKEILNTMAQDFDMKSVRVIGYTLTKVIKRIFDGIFVNFDQLRKIRELCKSDSVVFIPSHKSYMDFILLSLLCYDQEITLPAIAAGMDFMNSKLMGEALRRCGAFFIRRSFGTDKLYWTLFTEYVQTHLINSDRPVEFFVEGTRSRVGKSLFPKYGLMQVMLEPYLRGQLYDLIIVPVAINYDKILEELLYGYELLGFPKPKESTSGLLKARQILDKSFGTCHVTFCEPISVRNHFGTTLHRSAFVCQPDSQFVLSEREKREIRKLGHLIVCEHNKHSVVNVWPFASLAMLQLQDNSDTDIFNFSTILSEVKKQIVLLHRLGIKVQIEKSVEEDLRYYVKLHDDLFSPIDHRKEDFEMKLLHHPVDRTGTVDKKTMEKSVGRIVLNNYANKMMHEIVDESIISLVIANTKDNRQSYVFGKFRYVQSALAREFVCLPGEEMVSYANAIERMREAKIIDISDETIRVLDQDAIDFLQNVITPYITAFHVVIKVISNCGEKYVTQSGVCNASQQAIATHYRTHTPGVRLSFLSTDPIKNTFATLVAYKILVKKAKNFEIDYKLLEEVDREFSKYTKLGRIGAKL